MCEGHFWSFEEVPEGARGGGFERREAFVFRLTVLLESTYLTRIVIVGGDVGHWEFGYSQGDGAGAVSWYSTFLCPPTPALTQDQ